MMRNDLGPLQIQAMHIIWTQGPSTVGQVHVEINRERTARGETEYAYTTILTIMRNMSRRGFLRQERAAARSHLFTPVVTREEYRAQAAKALVSEVFNGDKKAALAAIGGAA